MKNIKKKQNEVKQLFVLVVATILVILAVVLGFMLANHFFG